MAEKDERVWSCRVCGPHKGSRQTWCEAGCGSDYQRMIAFIPESRALAAEGDLKEALDVIETFTRLFCGGGCCICTEQTAAECLLRKHGRLS